MFFLFCQLQNLWSWTFNMYGTFFLSVSHVNCCQPLMLLWTTQHYLLSVILKSIKSYLVIPQSCSQVPALFWTLQSSGPLHSWVCSTWVNISLVYETQRELKTKTNYRRYLNCIFQCFQRFSHCVLYLKQCHYLTSGSLSLVMDVSLSVCNLEMAGGQSKTLYDMQIAFYWWLRRIISNSSNNSRAPKTTACNHF